MNVALGVAERGHPEIVRGPRCDQAWWRKNLRAQFEEPLVGRIQIRDAEVKDGAGMIEFLRFGAAQHQPHSGTIEECQVREREKQRQTEHVTVECRGALEILHVDGDLAEILDAEIRRRSAHGCFTSGSNLVSIANYIL